MRLIDDPELIRDLSGDARLPQILLGEKMTAIEVVSNDLDAMNTLKKGTRCDTVKVTVNGALLSDGTDHTSGTADRTLSHCCQMNNVSPTFNAKGDPVDQTFLFLLCKKPDGTAGTVTDNWFGGGA